jgi:hypothetical protein
MCFLFNIIHGINDDTKYLFVFVLLSIDYFTVTNIKKTDHTFKYIYLFKQKTFIYLFIY